MNNINNQLKYLGALMLFQVLALCSLQLNAQDSTNKEEEVQTIAIKSRGLQRVGNVFESIWLIDNQTVIVPLKGTLEFDINHRFGTVNNGYEDFFGLYAPSNIRLALGYTPINKLMIGVGFAKDNMLWDLNWKYNFLKQDDSRGMPIHLTYYGNVAVDTRDGDNFYNSSDRFSYFHQLLVARKITRDFSLQAAISLSHFNAVEGYITSEGKVEGKMKNDHLAFAVSGRYKISDAFAFIANYDQPITKHPTNNPNPNISAGVELATPLHAFQVFFGNYKWIVPQYGNMYNSNNPGDGEFLIGFNITRLLDLKHEDLGDMMFKRKGKKEAPKH
jgi:Membrane bound beta barrel domain (DUF5777)